MTHFTHYDYATIKAAINAEIIFSFLLHVIAVGGFGEVAHQFGDHHFGDRTMTMKFFIRQLGPFHRV